MNKLWIRLSVAFSLVSLAGVVLAVTLINQQVDVRFRHYVARSQQILPTLTPALTDYYRENGSWRGIEATFAALLDADDGERGNGHGQMRGMMMGQQGGNIVLVDAGGRVVYDRLGMMAETVLSRAELSAAEPLTDGGQTIGYVLTGGPGMMEDMMSLSAQGQEFLAEINRILLQVGVAAALLGAALGVALARSLSAPLSRLAAAAHRVARGELNQRVPVRGAAEMQELAEAFNGMAGNLQQAETLRRNLMADIAHELRTPLTVVQGNLQAIIDDVYPLDKTEIITIYDETVMLNRLIFDLHDLAQADAGQLSLNVQSVAPDYLFDSVVSLFDGLAQEEGITLRRNFPPGLPDVSVDPDRTRQVLHNLLGNALRHTPPGGEITLRAEAEPGRVRVSVIDTGPGMSPDDAARVFDRFWRADKSRSRREGGAGLGLAISKKLVEAQGGDIGLHSAVGQGASFWFTLPVATGTK